MEKATRLVIDAGCFHLGGGLEQIVEFGVANAVFKSIFNICSNLSCFDFCICWDSNKSKRKELFPDYKNRKRESTTDKKEVIKYQMDLNYCRKVLLPSVGITNNFFAPGYEADDHIASVVLNLPIKENDHVFIVSSDHDMFQLITHNVSVYSPIKKKLFDFTTFCNQYGIEPWHWASVKALGGCSSDCVPGLKKVGEKRAIKLIQEGEWGNIFNAYHDLVSRNLKLVELPFQGCPKPKGWEKISFNEKEFNKVILKEDLDFFSTSFGQKSLSAFISGYKTSKVIKSIKIRMR